MQRVSVNLLDLNIAEAGFPQVAQRRLLAPHRPYPYTALGQGSGHAVHDRDAEEHR